MQITLSTIRTAYRSWIETLAEIMTTTFNRKKHWRVMAYKTNDGYEIYERKSGKTKILGTFAKTSDDSDIKKTQKETEKAGGRRRISIVLAIISVKCLAEKY